MPSFKLFHYQVDCPNSDEYHILKQEIFTQSVYYFECPHAHPVILDIGAYVGMSVLYFYHLFPGAHVTAIEPNPLAFRLLEHNVWQNQLPDVVCHQVAIASHQGEQAFHLDESKNQWWSTAGFSAGAWNHEQNTRQIRVATKPLADFLDKPIDLLKMDIEGAEQEALLSAGDTLKNVSQIILEYHPVSHQSLLTVTKLLRDQGFALTIKHKNKEITEKRAHGLCYIHGQRV